MMARIAGGDVHNPYHFVPVKQGGGGRIPVEDLRSGAVARLGHESYAEGMYSGRLLCRLRTETPTFVGSHRTRDATPQRAGEVAPFELDGEPAIPASSLRGLIGSLAETASNSALRVLSDRSLSFRHGAREGLSAIGMVVEGQDEEGRERFELLPLTLPSIETDRGAAATLSRPYWGMYGAFEPHLRVYVGGRDEIREPGTFQYRTYRADAEEFYGMRLERRSWERSTLGPSVAMDDFQYRKQYAKSGRPVDLLLAQTAKDGAEPRPWSQIPTAERPEYTRGIMRVLGCWGRDIPGLKKHELFIPYPEDATGRHTYPIPHRVVETFYRAADERTDDRGSDAAEPLPYEPKDTRRNRRDDPRNRLRLKQGDLVYFQPSEDGREVAEISFSSIWRSVPRRARSEDSESASVFTFFESIDPELLPFHEERQTVTPAEQLFGFVTRGEREKAAAGTSLRGRVRFSFARVEETVEDPYLEPCTLRVLASPKPPSPELYFKDRQEYERAVEAEEAPRGRFIEAKDLNAADHHPQGRKMYLHQKRGRGPAPWEPSPEHAGDLLQMKSEVRPLRDEVTFLFHIDFDNLDRDELALLCYALRPTSRFRHKLGMGKPIGLGRVEIDPVGLFLVDRAKRYSEEGLFAPRYARAWVRPDQDPNAWAESYQHERRAAEAGGEVEPIEDELVPRELAASYRKAMDPDIRQALELIGETVEPVSPVDIPQVEGGDRESETFKWFVNNRHRHGNREGLAPLSRASRELPTLEEPPEHRGR